MPVLHFLARKRNRFLFETPPGHTVSRGVNLYFSPLLNCSYDCAYCFLRGMYRSAHLLFFVNYEDYRDALVRAARTIGSQGVTFYAGYDCDPLAQDKLTGFCQLNRIAFVETVSSKKQENTVQDVSFPVPDEQTQKAFPLAMILLQVAGNRVTACRV